MIKNKMLKLVEYKNFLNKYYPVSKSKSILFLGIKYFIAILPLYSKKLTKPNNYEVDILLIGVDVDIQRAQKLVETLKIKGFTVSSETLSNKRALINSILNKPKNTNATLLLEATESNYIIQKYHPKIIISFTHNSVISSFIRDNIESIGGKYINIAHAVLGNIYNFTMFDFHYYFIFGESSYISANKNINRFGNTKLVKTGSIFINKELSCIPKIKNNNILFFSTWLSESVKDIIIENTNIVVDWAKKNSKYTLYIKLHPLENPDFINTLTKNVSNIKVLDSSTSMVEALSNISLVITSFSNASIEAAYANKPIIVINNSKMTDEYLHLEKYFLPRCKNITNLQQSIEKTFDNYDYFTKKCDEFTQYHLEKKNDCLEYVVNCIDDIYHNKENFDYIDIHNTFNIKKD